MGKIVKKEDGWYYGQVRTGTPELAYERFREEYNKAQGRNNDGFLNQLGRRKDIVHWRGSVFSKSVDNLDAVFCERIVRARIIGIVCTSYCRIADFPQDIPEEVADRYLDWLLQDGNKKFRLIGRKNGLGRTNRRRNINFR